MTKGNRVNKPRPKSGGPANKKGVNKSRPARRSRAVAQAFGHLSISGEGQGYGMSGKAALKYSPASFSPQGVVGVSVPKPTFNIKQSGQGTITVTGGDVFSGGAIASTMYNQNTVISSTFLHPRYIASSRLNSMAGLYTRYRFKRIRLTWIPNNSVVSSAAAGELMYSFERDVTLREAPGNVIDYSDFYARQDSVVGREYVQFSAPFVPDTHNWMYIDDTADVEPRTSYQGVAYLIAGPGLTSTAAGRTFVEYEIEFTEPRTANVAYDAVYRAETTSVVTYSTMTTASNFFTNPKQSRSTNLLLTNVANDGVYIDVTGPWVGYLHAEGYATTGSISISATGQFNPNLTSVGGVGSLTSVYGAAYGDQTNAIAAALPWAGVRYVTRKWLVGVAAGNSLRLNMGWSNALTTNSASSWFLTVTGYVLPALAAERTALGLVRPVWPSKAIERDDKAEEEVEIVPAPPRRGRLTAHVDDDDVHSCESDPPRQTSKTLPRQR